LDYFSDLDPTFGSGRKVVTDLEGMGECQDEANDLAVQADRKRVAVGRD
jgi:hypothetical protein